MRTVVSPRRAQGASRPPRVTGHVYFDGAGYERVSSGGRELRTEAPYRQMRSVNVQKAGLLPREGAGDHRGSGRGGGAFRFDAAAEDRSEHIAHYRPRQNNLPVGRPYVYGASRNTRSYRNLDMAAIQAADEMFNRDGRTRNGPARTVDYDAILQLKAEKPGLSQRQIGEIVGCSLVTVGRVLRAAGPPSRKRAHTLPQAAAERAKAEIAVRPAGARRIRPADLARIKGAA